MWRNWIRQLPDRRTHPGAESFPEGWVGGTGEIDFAVEGHEDLNRLDSSIGRRKGDPGVHVLVREVFDGVAEDLKPPAGVTTDAPPPMAVCVNQRYCA